MHPGKWAKGRTLKIVCMCRRVCVRQCFEDTTGNYLFCNVKWLGIYTIRHFLCIHWESSAKKYILKHRT